MGLFSSVGSIFNKVTGATASANLQNKFQKEFAKNAHQWEMQDLQKAGLNPALTATGGNGASAGGAGGTTGSSGINPIDAIGSMIGMRNQTAQTNADANLKNAQAMQIIEMLPFEKDVKLQMIQNLNTGSMLNLSSARYNDRRGSGRGFNISTPFGGGGVNY